MSDAETSIVANLVYLHRKNNVNIAFEGGEAETLVLDCPLFCKKIVVIESENKLDSECSGVFVVKKADLVDKA